MTRAKDLRAADAGQAGDGIVEIDEGVIRQKLVVVCSVGGVNGDQHERGRRRFEQRDAEIAHFDWQLGLSLIFPDLRQHLVYVRVGFDIEIDEHAHRPVVGIDGKHVVHVVHSAHLRFDGSCDRLLNRFRIGADVIG